MCCLTVLKYFLIPMFIEMDINFVQYFFLVFQIVNILCPNGQNELIQIEMNLNELKMTISHFFVVHFGFSLFVSGFLTFYSLLFLFFYFLSLFCFFLITCQLDFANFNMCILGSICTSEMSENSFVSTHLIFFCNL